MVHKEQKPTRGRPRQFDETEVLNLARAAFWRTGYQATSLDDLSEVTGLKRPSLYAAFGDKRDLFLAAMKTYRERNVLRAGQILSEHKKLRPALEALYAAAVAIYAPNGGCFILGAAPSEAETDAAVRAQLRGINDDLDACFAARFKQAQKDGEIGKAVDTDLRGKLATGVLHTLSLRARGGEKRAALEALAEAAADLLCRL